MKKRKTVVLKELKQKDFPLRIVKDLGMGFVSSESKRKVRKAIFECPVCMKEYTTQIGDVKAGKSKQCKQCSHGEQHGYARGEDGKKNKLYMIYEQMKARCNNPKNKSYHRYGGRGIKMCDEWQKSFMAFRNWSIRNGYTESKKRNRISIDRRDNNGNYEPSNCRWVDDYIQAANKEYRGSSKSGHIGVFPYNNTGTYVASVRSMGKTVVVARGVSLDEAIGKRNQYIVNNELANKKEMT